MCKSGIESIPINCSYSLSLTHNRTGYLWADHIIVYCSQIEWTANNGTCMSFMGKWHFGKPLLSSICFNFKYVHFFSLSDGMFIVMDPETILLIWWKWKPFNIKQPTSSTKSTSLMIQTRYKIYHNKNVHFSKTKTLFQDWDCLSQTFRLLRWSPVSKLRISVRTSQPDCCSNLLMASVSLSRSQTRSVY